MATRPIAFQVTATDQMAYWIAVDEHDVTLVNGKGTVALEQGVEHVLVWWMIGNPGDALSITGADGTRQVVNIKESKIPPNTNKGAGYRRFKV